MRRPITPALLITTWSAGVVRCRCGCLFCIIQHCAALAAYSLGAGLAVRSNNKTLLQIIMQDVLTTKSDDKRCLASPVQRHEEQTYINVIELPCQLLGPSLRNNLSWSLLLQPFAYMRGPQATLQICS